MKEKQIKGEELRKKRTCKTNLMVVLVTEESVLGFDRAYKARHAERPSKLSLSLSLVSELKKLQKVGPTKRILPFSLLQKSEREADVDPKRNTH